ncbi:hypothetical protein ACO0LB_20200 [Undibacterium sp. SXout7W]|uniref:hypothetical protein n=1 Tax=Undibacterium sp. SXout7W TaxID=3413049 RepID=UPI003BF3C4B0
MRNQNHETLGTKIFQNLSIDKKIARYQRAKIQTLGGVGGDMRNISHRSKISQSSLHISNIRLMNINNFTLYRIIRLVGKE